MKDSVLLRKDGQNVFARLSTLSLESFRNYDDLGLDLGPGLNIVEGPNAQGKTNLLEAIYLLSTTRLLRGQRDSEAIKEGSTRARVSALTADTDSKIEVVLERGLKKKVQLNGLGLPRAADIMGRLPAVCISAVDMEIVRGEPADRRMFLDLDLSGLYPSYLRHFAAYKRALEQRNALLKDARERPVSSSAFEPWEVHLAEHGVAIRKFRMDYVGQLSEVAQLRHFTMGEGERLTMTYSLKDEGLDADSLLDELQRSRSHDIVRGSTGTGPHRDDLSIMIDGKEARLFGSQGQQRTSVVSIKLASLDVLTQQLGAPPLLLMDDIFSDLDLRRRSLLVEIVIEHAGQALLTCTEAESAGERILSLAQRYSVRSGTVTRH